MNHILILAFSFILSHLSIHPDQEQSNSAPLSHDEIIRKIVQSEKDRVLTKADLLVKEKPITITASSSERSAGGKHDFFSEGPYWWPDPSNQNGPYIRRDGLRNPENFAEHDDALLRFSDIVATLTSAYLITGEAGYVKAAMKHLNAWCVDTSTMMYPNFLYAQAIKGICTGRGVGLIDAVPLIDVARSVTILEKSKYTSVDEFIRIKEWFSQFLKWITTHQYGIDEINAKNNHGTWCLAQITAYSQLTGNTELLQSCRKRYMEVILPDQMQADGSFPQELARTKPYSYSLFNLDAMALAAWMLSDNANDLWNYTLKDGRNLNKGLAYMMPYLKDISKWSSPKDVDNWESQPGQRNFMFFAAIKQNNQEWFSLWESLGRKKDYRSSDRIHLMLWAGLKDTGSNNSNRKKK